MAFGMIAVNPTINKNLKIVTSDNITDSIFHMKNKIQKIIPLLSNNDINYVKEEIKRIINGNA